MVDEKQMEAVFKTSRVDPESGNEVPTGSLPEEVRDDIPAKLSEGEYVVPADVVRYYGVRFFEDLRNQAKQGWSDMESGGRIGGEPTGMEVIEPEDDLPFDVSELQTVEMAEGGFVEGYAEGGMPETPTSDVDTGFTYVEYTNQEGRVMLIPFFMGEPMIVIPEGFYPLGEQSPTQQAKPKSRKTQEQPDRTAPEPIDYASLSKDELASMVKDQTTFGMDDGISMVMMGMNPMFGLLFKGLMKVQANQTKRELERRISDPNLSEEDKAAYTNLLDIADQGRPGLFNRLAEMFGKDKEDEQQEELISDPSYDPAAVDSAIEEALGYTPEVSSDTSNIVFDAGDLDIPKVVQKPLPTNPRIGYESGLDTQQSLPNYLKDSFTPAAKPKGSTDADRAAMDKIEKDKLAASRSYAQAVDNTAEVMQRQVDSGASVSEIIETGNAAKDIKDRLASRAKGTSSIGFSKGGLASKKKKK